MISQDRDQDMYVWMRKERHMKRKKKTSTSMEMSNDEKPVSWRILSKSEAKKNYRWAHMDTHSLAT